MQHFDHSNSPAPAPLEERLTHGAGRVIGPDNPVLAEVVRDLERIGRIAREVPYRQDGIHEVRPNAEDTLATVLSVQQPEPSDTQPFLELLRRTNCIILTELGDIIEHEIHLFGGYEAVVFNPPAWPLPRWNDALIGSFVPAQTDLTSVQTFHIRYHNDGSLSCEAGCEFSEQLYTFDLDTAQVTLESMVDPDAPTRSRPVTEADLHFLRQLAAEIVPWARKVLA